LRAVAAVANANTGGANWKAAATRLVDILIAGLRIELNGERADAHD
jgi:hypothetical protein